MKFPISWINDFVDLKKDIEYLRNGLTFSGTEVEEVINDGEEVVFDFNFTVNRPDLMSIFGLAREASAIFGLQKPIYKAKAKRSSLKIDNFISIEVEDKDLCPRYRAYLIKGVKVKESPDFIKKRLLLCGLRPINGVVDVTNYVLLEYGHPLHAFDLKYIKGSKIIGRRAKQGEKIILLDGSEKKLKSNNLVIADSQRALAVAGVMGGEESGVTFLTKDVLLEGAVFSPPSVRRTSKELNVHTDASHRFERGTDFNGPVNALEKCAEMILEICGGELCEDFIDIKDEKNDVSILFRTFRLKQISGIEIPEERVKEILSSLGFEVEDKNKEFNVKVPSFRVDVKREIDLIEEVVRVYGLDKLKSIVPQIVDVESGSGEDEQVEQKIKEHLSSKGLFETIHFSMTDPQLNSIFEEKKEEIRILNPLSEQNSVLRKSLLSNLLLTAKRNASYGRKTFGLYEIGNVYSKNDNLPIEEKRCAILLYEEETLKSFYKIDPLDFYFLKGLIQSLFEKLHLDFSFVENCDISGVFSSKHSLNLIFDGKNIGFLSYLDPLKLQSMEIKGKVAVAEFSLSPLLRKIDPKFQMFSRQPQSRRDISIIVDENLKWGEISNAISSCKLDEVVKTELIEIYRDEKIFSNKKSVTFSIYFQSKEKTISEDEVESSLAKIINSLKEKCKAVLR